MNSIESVQPLSHASTRAQLSLREWFQRLAVLYSPLVEMPASAGGAGGWQAGWPRDGRRDGRRGMGATQRIRTRRQGGGKALEAADSDTKLGSAAVGVLRHTVMFPHALGRSREGRPVGGPSDLWSVLPARQPLPGPTRPRPLACLPDILSPDRLDKLTNGVLLAAPVALVADGALGHEIVDVAGLRVTYGMECAGKGGARARVGQHGGAGADEGITQHAQHSTAQQVQWEGVGTSMLISVHAAHAHCAT